MKSAMKKNTILLRLLSPLEPNLRKVNNWHKRGFGKAGLGTRLFVDFQQTQRQALYSELHHHHMERRIKKKASIYYKTLIGFKE